MLVYYTQEITNLECLIGKPVTPELILQGFLFAKVGFGSGSEKTLRRVLQPVVTQDLEMSSARIWPHRTLRDYLQAQG